MDVFVRLVRGTCLSDWIGGRQRERNGAMAISGHPALPPSVPPNQFRQYVPRTNFANTSLEPISPIRPSNQFRQYVPRTNFANTSLEPISPVRPPNQFRQYVPRTNFANTSPEPIAQRSVVQHFALHVFPHQRSGVAAPRQGEPEDRRVVFEGDGPVAGPDEKLAAGALR